MKIRKMVVIGTLLLPFALFANQAEQEQMMQEMILKMQKQVIVMYDGMLPLMQEMRSCINGANSKSQAENCSTTFAKKYENFLHKAELGEFVDTNGFEERFEFGTMVWSPSVKRQVLQELDKSISDIKNHKDCLNKYNSIDGFQKCEQFMN